MRGAILVVAGLGLMGSVLLVSSLPVFWVLGFWSLIALVGLLVERYRYKPIEPAVRGPDWEPTTESFIDPETGGLVRVLYHPGTGERRYVAAHPPTVPADTGTLC